MTFSDEQIRSLLADPANHPPSARHLGFELIDFSVDGGWAEIAFSHGVVPQSVACQRA